MSRERTIQQQYFTRDREGIFRTNEGFDTVAKSPGLDNGFIKSALHPYCVYKGPQELLGSDEADASRYPDALGLFHADNGDLVIGRSVYVSTDFTGHRSAFFTHQYVVPKQRKEEFVRDPRRIFAIRGFQSSYDIRSGKSIPELQDIDYDAGSFPENPDGVLARLGIDRKLFQQLLYAMMASATGKKKVYIALDTHVSASSEEAKRLMEIVYSCLPYAIRRLLGFVTYQQEPEGKQHYHVMFVEKGSIRLPDRQLEKDVLFDFPNRRFTGTDLPDTHHPYLDYVWDRRHEPESLRQLHDFCDEALGGEGTAAAFAAIAVPTYDELCTLFEIKQGREALYENNRTGVMNSILNYLTAETAAHKQQLNDLFRRLFSKEARDGHQVPSADYIEPLLRFYSFADESSQATLISCFALFIQRAASTSENGIAGAVPLFDRLLGDDAVLRSVLRQLYGQHPRTVEQYVAYRIEAAGSVQSFVDEMSFWLQSADEWVTQRFFANEVLGKIKKLINAEKAKRSGAARTLYTYFDHLPERKNKQHLKTLCEQFKLEISLETLEGIALPNLGYDDIIQLDFMLDRPSPELVQSLGSGGRLTLDLLMAVYRVLTLDRGRESNAAKSLEKLGPLDLEHAQEMICRALADRIGPADFSKITYAFYHPGAGMDNNAWDAAEYNFDRLLEYISEHTRNTSLIYEFMAWSAADERFSSGSGVNAHYRSALIRYFDRHDSRAFKNKEVRDLLLGVPNRAFAALFREIKLRQSPALVKFMATRKKRLFRIGILALPLALVIVLLSVYWTPITGFILKPTPTLTVDALPEKTAEPEVTVTASASDGGYDPEPKIYVNGELAGYGSISKSVSLKEGENTIEIKSENKYGKVSEPLVKKVLLDIPADEPPDKATDSTPEDGKGASAGSSTGGSGTDEARSAKDGRGTKP
ncbi:hypothetical protein [Paenibacillus sp. J2TS4]|uniref:GAP1-N2 domain-containing protein n=1 Tax=Paenibacillus sp. J2TS4 TaxID=2807194 RepID=UPI001B06925F|nr:hypothetical protein [Paenibacillus sp. J2TS4]GIP32011.1 hypothetical protein J2TS4_12210 [Paenibacillus sp. J2TS4]